MKKLLLLIGFALSLSMNGQTNTIKIGKLEIMKKDLGKFNWDDGNAAIDKLGDGWRLPTIEELNKIYYYRKKIGGFDEKDFYCSSSYNLDPNGDEIWCLGFTNDGIPNRMTSLKLYEHNVRAVRTIKVETKLKKKK